MKKIWYVSQALLLGLGNSLLVAYRESSEHEVLISALNDKHIVHEYQRLKSNFRRHAYMRNSLTVGAIAATCGMLYWWSKSEAPFCIEREQQKFLEHFNLLPDEKKYEFLLERTQHVDTLSWQSIMRKVIPYAVGTAASNLVFSSLQLILMQPLSRLIDRLYCPVELKWFINSRTNVLELFEALQKSGEHLDSNREFYHKMMFIDLMNSLMVQIERVLAFMHYKIEDLNFGEEHLHLLGIKPIQRLKKVCNTCVASCNYHLAVQEPTDFSVEVATLRDEFEMIIKQFQVIEKTCM